MPEITEQPGKLDLRSHDIAADKLKANAVQLFKAKGIVFRTV